LRNAKASHSAAFDGISGGGHGGREPSIESGGSSGDTTDFGSASAMQNPLGIESAGGGSTPHHAPAEGAYALGDQHTLRAGLIFCRATA
jgi:hypothetical protein